ncbi:lipid II flippase MurJ [Helicobacter sp. T3_23-1059]
MQCGKILDFLECTDTKSANIPKNPKNLHSHTANTRIVGENGIDFSQNNIDFSENNNPPSPNCQNVAEGATNDKKNPPSLAERGLKGRVKSTLESSPKSSLDSNAKSSLQASNNEECDNPKSCHTEGFTPEVSKNGLPRATSCARNDAKKQSLANKIKSELKAFFTQFLPAMLGSSTAQIASFIDTILASFLASGSISYLYYANRIFQLPLAIFAIAISTALFPMVAKSIKAGQEASALKSMKKSFWFLCFMLLACAIGGAMLNQHIIWLLYEHGKFSRADTIECALVFAGYMVGLVPFGLARIFSLYLYATMRQALAAKISAISLGIGVGFSLIFMQFLGAFGLALAGSLSGFVLFLLTIKAFGFAKFWGIIADSKLSAFLVVFIGLEVAFLWIFISFVQIP